MGENPKKYHVTEEGDVYRINEDGSFTSMGNAEKLSNSTSVDSKVSIPAKEEYNEPRGKLLKQHNSRIGLWMFCLFLILLLVGAISYIVYQRHKYVNEIVSIDSIGLANVPIVVQSSEQIDTTPTKQISKNESEPINQEIKPSEKISEEKAPKTQHTDESNRMANYYVEPPCGQMEGPDNFFVLFPDGKTYLCSAHLRRIDEMLKNLPSYSDYKIVIDGYLSSFTGTHTSNMEDARLRVNNIVTHLKSKGIPGDRIKAEVHDIHVDYFGPYGHVSIMVK